MAWRLARSLEDLRAQADAFAPHRNKASDGTIGNAEHAARASRHNPNAAGVVTAFDLTHDPAGGMDTYAYARALVENRDLIPNDLDYLISNRQVASRERDWTWRTYTGPDPHTNHAHFGVGRGPDSAPTGPFDDPSQWHFDQLLVPGASTSEEDQLMAASDDIIKAVRDGNDNLAKNVGDAANNIVSNLRAFITAAVDPAKIAAAIAKELPEGSADAAAVEAAVRKVFADAAKD